MVFIFESPLNKMLAMYWVGCQMRSEVWIFWISLIYHGSTHRLIPQRFVCMILHQRGNMRTNVKQEPIISKWGSSSSQHWDTRKDNYFWSFLLIRKFPFFATECEIKGKGMYTLLPLFQKKNKKVESFSSQLSSLCTPGEREKSTKSILRNWGGRLALELFHPNLLLTHPRPNWMACALLWHFWKLNCFSVELMLHSLNAHEYHCECICEMFTCCLNQHRKKKTVDWKTKQLTPLLVQQIYRVKTSESVLCREERCPAVNAPFVKCPTVNIF